MAICVLILGSNMGNRHAIIQKAIDFIDIRVGVVKKQSHFYESEPWGYDDPNSYFNKVVLIESELEPHLVLKKCLEIESEFGRTRSEKGYAGRTLDIDVLFYDDMVIREPDLVVPHPQLQDRNFVLYPLNEIIPDYIHPLLNKTIGVLKDECKDKGWINKCP